MARYGMKYDVPRRECNSQPLMHGTCVPLLPPRPPQRTTSLVLYQTAPPYRLTLALGSGHIRGPKCPAIPLCPAASDPFRCRRRHILQKAKISNGGAALGNMRLRGHELCTQTIVQRRGAFLEVQRAVDVRCRTQTPRRANDPPARHTTTKGRDLTTDAEGLCFWCRPYSLWRGAGNRSEECPWPLRWPRPDRTLCWPPSRCRDSSSPHEQICATKCHVSRVDPKSHH